MSVEAVLPEAVHDDACRHLLAHVRAGQRQEDLCFALWRPSRGATRTTALVAELILPKDGERTLHGGASFTANYLSRAVRQACASRTGLAFMHSHLTAGWQGMSEADVTAERDRIGGPVRVTGLPLLGLTLGTDGMWSARLWSWGKRQLEREWAGKVRVVGRRIRLTYNDDLMPPPRRRRILRRTIDTWGAARQADLARLRIVSTCL